MTTSENPFRMIGAFLFGLMSETVTLSLNELRALLRKSFEGIFAHNHDWNALTDLVLWLEFQDLGGLDTFFEAEPSLREASPRVIQNDNEIVVDGNGASLLAFNTRACDLLLADVNLNGRGVLHVRNTKNSEVITASVSRCAKQGYAVVAWWLDREGYAFMALQNANEAAPSLYKVKVPKTFSSYPDITILVGREVTDIENLYPEWINFRDKAQLSHNQIVDRYEEYLNNGIRLTQADYKRLCHFADRVLVEATEKSRQGAGE